MERYRKIKRKIARAGLLIVTLMFIAMVIVGIFFSQKSISLFIGMIVATTILVVLIYVILMFVRMREKALEKEENE